MHMIRNSTEEQHKKAPLSLKRKSDFQLYLMWVKSVTILYIVLLITTCFLSIGNTMYNMESPKRLSAVIIDTKIMTCDEED
jgi:hypothetical protein